MAPIWCNACATARGTVRGRIATLDIPTLDIPTLDIPTLDIPTLDIPTLDIPTLDIPTLDIPTLDIPTLDIPTLDIPTLDIPTLDIPTLDIPTLDIPTLGIPRLGIPRLDATRPRPGWPPYGVAMRCPHTVCLSGVPRGVSVSCRRWRWDSAWGIPPRLLAGVTPVGVRTASGYEPTRGSGKTGASPRPLSG